MMLIEIINEEKMKSFGKSVGLLLHGGEVIELIGDVGSGKTTFVKGLAVGLGIEDNVQSPSFTISRVYSGRNDITLAHYDFYRLNDAGIMANELCETIDDPKTITIIEWGGIANSVLPIDRLSIKVTSPTENSRKLIISSGGEVSDKIAGKIDDFTFKY